MKSQRRFYVFVALSNLVDAILGSYVTLSTAASGASTFVVGLMAALLLLPWVGSPIFGVLVDRIGVKQAIVGITIFRVSAILIIAAISMSNVAKEPFYIWAVLAFIIGLSDMCSDLSVQTYIGQLSGIIKLEKVYGNVASIQTVSVALCAPAIAGFLIGVPEPVTLAVAAMVGVVIVFLATSLSRGSRIDVSSESSASSSGSFFEETSEGFFTILGNSWLLRTALSVSVFNILNSASSAVAVVYVLQHLGISPSTLGVVWALVGLTGAFGGWLCGQLSEKLGFKLSVFLGGLGLVLDELGLLITDSLWLISCFWIVAALTSPLFGISLISRRQTMVARDKLGRVNSAFQFIGIGIAPVGALIGGAIATFTGAWPVLCGIFAINLVVFLLCRPWQLKPVFAR